MLETCSLLAGHPRNPGMWCSGRGGTLGAAESYCCYMGEDTFNERFTEALPYMWLARCKT